MLLGEGDKGLGTLNAYKALVFSHLCCAACTQLDLTIGVKFLNLTLSCSEQCKEEFKSVCNVKFSEAN